jgi:hypothetical protein
MTTTDDLPGFAQWRGSVEGRLGRLEAQAEIEGMLLALRAAQQDHTARLTEVEDRLGNVEGALELVRVGVEAIHGKLDTLIRRG